MLLEHYRNPQNYGTLDDFSFEHHDSNPLCGDDLTFQINLDSDDTVEDVRFNGKGCAISQASASMLTEVIIGKTITDLKLFEQKDILELIGIESLSLNPSRLKCALLSLKVLKVGLYNYLGDSILKTKSSDEFSESKLDEKYSNSS